MYTSYIEILRRNGRVVEGGGLENRCTKVPWVRILLPPPHFGEMTELADGARLLSECGGYTPPRVRIPLSPPYNKKTLRIGAFFLISFFHVPLDLVPSN